MIKVVYPDPVFYPSRTLETGYATLVTVVVPESNIKGFHYLYMLREREKKISNTEKRTATLLTFLNRCNPSGSPSGSGPPTAG
jgi:hypothetical protein